MRYSGEPWTLDGVPHVDVVQELLDAGLEPAGCLVNNLSPEQDLAFVRGYPEETRKSLLAGMGRPVPVLVSSDRLVAGEVSDMYGVPALRMRTFLADGALVETSRRWTEVPPWPGRTAPFHRFATVEREMARSVAPGRSQMISDRSPAGLLEDHRRHVEIVAAVRGAPPAPYPDIDSVAGGWNAAFAHDRVVARRADHLVSVGVTVPALVALALAPVVVPGAGWLIAALVVVVALWWLLPGLALTLRSRIPWRPRFVRP